MQNTTIDMSTFGIIIYFIGSLCAYLSIKALIKNQMGMEWTILDRNKILVCSILSWIAVGMAIIFSIITFIEDHSDPRKPSKW